MYNIFFNFEHKWLQNKQRFYAAAGCIVLFLMLCIQPAQAAEVKADSGLLFNLDMQNSTVRQVLSAIEKQSDYTFFYYDNAVDVNRRVTIKLTDKPIGELLDELFKGTNSQYTINKNQVYIRRVDAPRANVAPQATQQQKRRITGVVVDQVGETVIGANVVEKGTTNGTVTDLDGSFSLNVSNDAVIQISYIGFLAQEIPVAGKTKLEIVLVEDTKTLEDLVVVGYGVLKKRNVVGAIENLSGEAIENRPNPNITRSLQGQIPGLNIVQVDGKPGHEGRVSIRQQNTNFKARREGGGEHSNTLGQGGSALVLIDGAEGDLSSVNPDDIANISVLKDASSAAVYGARGAFGVILITTKDPQKGKVRVNYSGSVSAQTRTVRWEDHVVSDPVEWVEGFRQSYLNSSPTATVPALMNNYFPYSDAWYEELKRRQADPTMDNYDIDANGNYIYYGNTNWLEEFYKKRNFSTAHSVTVQGGQESINYYVSGRYYGQDGIYKVGDEDFNKYNLRAKGSIKIRPWLTLENNTSFVKDFNKQPMVHYGQNVVGRQLSYFAFPVANIKNPDGSWTQTAARSGYAAFAEGTSWQEDNNLEVANTTILKMELVPEILTVTADFTYKGIRAQRRRMENQYTYYTGLTASGQDNVDSSLEDWRYDTNYMSSNLVGTYTPKLTDKHDLNIVFGGNIEDRDYKNQKTYRRGNLYPSTPSFTLMDGDYISATSGGNTWGLMGVFSRVNYSYDERYLAEISTRYDGSSKFPVNSQWGFFPSASLGWRLSEEPWFKGSSDNWLDNLKFRASVGSLGNANISPYQYLETMSISKSSVLINGTNSPYTGAPSLIPDDITWEKVVTYNLGVDMEFLNSRLNVVGDIYRRNTDDLYTVGPNLPHVLGSVAPRGNYASLKTEGWELSMNWRDSFILGGKPFNYAVRGMVWDSRSWVTEYFNESGDLTTYYKGMEIGEIWGFRTAGLYASNAEAKNGPAYNFFKNGEMFEAYAGDLRFVDIDGDGIMTKGNRTLESHGDMEIIGNMSPRYHFSLNLSGNWNNIGLSMLFQGVGQRDWYPWTESGFFWGQHNRAYNFLMKSQTGDHIVNIDKTNENWVVTNMDKDPYWSRRVSLAANRNDGPLTWENTHYLQNAAYVRLKNVTIDYSFNRNICSRIGLEALKVYMAGENLFTYSPLFKRTDMFDPEVIESGDSDFAASTSGGLNGTGQGYSYPMLKNVTFGLNLTF
ncbi:MAG: TonB-dependent receptor [Proteiniphilum sp.]|nr:TonB-dependent receptor [Proteiniphilum sp.]